MEQLIFEKPSLAPFPQRVGWAFFTALFWIVWVYLWMPLVTLLGWALGLHAYSSYFGEPGFFDTHQIGRLFLIYTAVIVIMGGSLLLWARIEFVRFHDVNRRTIPVAVSVEEIALYAKVPLATLEDWTSTRRIVLLHDKHGHVIILETAVGQV